MPLAAGARLGPYEILSPIGAGGMGEVYKANDTRLDRIVAVKVLPEHFAESPERKARFEREAKTISQLNHPNVCTLYDVGEHDGAGYLVMEYIEGETLAERLKKGALKLDHVLEYGFQITAGLAAAHRGGIVHRDLKPGNIMLTKSGVKILDFGLAKAVGGYPVAEDSRAPTQQRDLTIEHAIVGTLRYMAPEQIEGKPVDARTDVWAMGAVLYEMVTGAPAFEGRSQASLITAIMSVEPAPMSENALSPRFLDHLVRRCLAKEPEERWQSVSDLGSEMKWLEANGERFAEKAAADSPGRRFALLAAVLLALTATIAYLLGTRASTIDVPNLLAAAILPPSDVTLNGQERPLVSPDGSHVAFVATEPSGESTLWVRRLDSLEPERLPGTEGVFYPFWSPDSAHIAFFARGALYRVPISGGAPQRICDAGNSRGGAWSPNGVILFTPRSEDVLYAVEEGGGEPVPLTALDPSEDIVSHRWPHFLPDGHHFLYLEWGGHPGGIYVGSLDNDMRRPLIRNATSPVFASGYLLFVRSGTLYAQPFDDEKMELTGDAIALLDDIVMDPNARHAMFSADDGTIVYRQGVGIASMYWVDRRGERLGTVTTEGLDFRDPSLSPDGSTVASCGFDSETGIPNLWLSDVSRRLSSRVTSGPKQAYFPVWSPDGEHIIFTILQRGSGDLYQVASRGGGDPKEILKSETVAIATSWAPDGQWIALYRPGANGDWDIWMLPSSGKREPEPFIRTAFDERYPQFSPDGNWVAYSSNETGRYEVYVQTFPGSDFKLRISTTGGRVARWRGDGRELYYIAEDGMLMAVPIELGASLEAGEPSALFRTPWNAKNFLNSSLYDVTSDGERFVLATPTGDPSPGFRLLLNWKQVVARHSSP